MTRDWRQDKRQRTVLIGVRFAPDEYAVLSGLAEQYHTTDQEVIRRLLSGVLRITTEGFVRENQGGATRGPALAAPDRTPLGKQEAG